jgi:hypothetical protein
MASRSSGKLAMASGDLAGQIRTRAYQIWEGEGRPQGRDEAHWLRAESEIRAALMSAPSASSSPAKPARKRTRPRGRS